ncbi:transposase [Myxococcus faecalis]|uniref:IS66 family transposase n=1 Tax=Myxococcus faecalis TaxID=3115646 RepID=UPI0038D1BE8E
MFQWWAVAPVQRMPLPSTAPALLARVAALTVRGPTIRLNICVLNAYVHSSSRGDVTPQADLGGTRGYLLVDGYTGYNRVTLPEGHTRVARWVHVRCKFFDAQATAPDARRALDFILDLYRVEYEATQRGVPGGS